MSDEAIDWLILLGSGSATASQQAAFEAWRQRSPAHLQALDEAAALLEDVGQTSAADEFRTIGAAMRSDEKVQRPSRRGLLIGSGMAAAAAVTVVGSGALGPPAGLLADFRTGVGQRRKVDLEDGSTIWLNTSSAVSIDFSENQRRARLLDGEALFQIAPGSPLPFEVVTNGGSTFAFGNAYSLRRRGGVTDLVVTEGEVDVRSEAESARLTSGQQVSFGEGIIGSIRAVDTDAASAWVRGKLIFNAQPLAEVVEELARYQFGQMIVRGEALKRLSVTGVFDLDDPRATLRAISRLTQAPIIRLPLLTIIG